MKARFATLFAACAWFACTCVWAWRFLQVSSAWAHPILGRCFLLAITAGCAFACFTWTRRLVKR